MTKPIIQVRQIGKEYAIGARGELYATLREALMQRFGSFGSKSRAAPPRERFWALRDVSFELQPGEVLGVIGRNGAGKSTLLKILSRITEPTAGEAVLYGRVGSLLEVGTGFHPELTGRENIFLNGAILGMRKAEIQRKFDEIIAFAEVEKFLDTPVKRYSSGMTMRLAFAVAAHLEPEILVVDEVLAVGDAAFQRKCLNRMQQVGSEGRTVLFVSHNMPAITRLCSRAIWLEKGQLREDGPAMDVVGSYMNGVAQSADLRSWEDMANAPGNDQIRLCSVGLVRTSDNSPAYAVTVENELELRISYRVLQAPVRFRCAALFMTQGVCAFTTVEPLEQERSQTGMYESVVRIPAHLLAEGEYTINLSMFASRGSRVHLATVPDAIAFHVTDPMSGSSARGDYAERFVGVMRPKLDWDLRIVN